MNRRNRRATKSILGAFAVYVGTFGTPAIACEYVTWPFQLPGETEKDARERSEQILSDQLTNTHFRREEFDLKNAKTIYIARVVSNNREQDVRIRPAAMIEAVEAIKGKLPTGTRSLAETEQHSCSNWGDGHGDGEGTAAPVGSLIIVFEGLPKSQDKPNGVDSLRATSIRSGALLDRLSKYGKEFDEGVTPTGQ